jgi:hypothetical protein
MPMLGELIHTGQFVLTKECEQSYWQIKNYRYEDLTPAQKDKGTEAKPLKKDVDLVDGWQYIASRRLPTAELRPVPSGAAATGDFAELDLANAKVEALIAGGLDPDSATVQDARNAAQDLEDRLLGRQFRDIAADAAKRARGEHRYAKSSAVRGLA